MAKLTNPLMSLKAIGALGKDFTIRQRGKHSILEKKPHPTDARSLAQLSWRTMYQKATALWHALSDAEKQSWESTARPFHMTGYAYFMSKALKPNPGIYLPLAGGTMQGTINMDGNAILGLSAPLYLLSPVPISGRIFLIQDAGKSPFSAKINGDPSSTELFYDTETNENMFNGLADYDGDDPWGQIILHNTTRGNSRKIVSVDIAANKIVTTASVDDWTNNDDITTSSQTCTNVDRWFDVDISAKVPATTAAIYPNIFVRDKEDAYDLQRQLRVHPYESYDTGKVIAVAAALALDFISINTILPVIDQKICVDFNDGFEDVRTVMKVLATFETVQQI